MTKWKFRAHPALHPNTQKYVHRSVDAPSFIIILPPPRAAHQLIFCATFAGNIMEYKGDMPWKIGQHLLQNQIRMEEQQWGAETPLVAQPMSRSHLWQTLELT